MRPPHRAMCVCVHSVCLARASCIRVLCESPPSYVRIRLDCDCAAYPEVCGSWSSQCVPGTTYSSRTVGGVTGIEADEKAALVNNSSAMAAFAASCAVSRGVSTSRNCARSSESCHCGRFIHHSCLFICFNASDPAYGAQGDRKSVV